MQYIADLHIHSKYSRATSQQMDLENIDKWARIKGFDIIATGDWMHLKCLLEIKRKLKPLNNGLFVLKKNKNIKPIYFILSTEISSIYKFKDKVRKIHNLILVPDLKSAEKINKKLDSLGCNLKSDGRPIVGLSAKELLKISLDASPSTMFIPAHIWTPWFSLFGANSGFDAVEECFEEMTPYIRAMETGLSSDPGMNWRWSALDKITLISNSDAHSFAKLGREVNILELKKISYKNIYEAIWEKRKTGNRLLQTLEFFPQEGKYHFDGHRACNICFSPAQTKKYKNICPKCKKPLTIGVAHRVDDLSDRAEKKPRNAVLFQNLIPLQEIIADAFSMGVNTKTVQSRYDYLIEKFKNEFNVLLNIKEKDLAKTGVEPNIIQGIIRMRQGKVRIQPGYDGEYGKISIFSDQERGNFKKQKRLF